MTADVVDFVGVLAGAAGSVGVRLVDEDFDAAALAAALVAAFFLTHPIHVSTQSIRRTPPLSADAGRAAAAGAAAAASTGRLGLTRPSTTFSPFLAAGQ